MGTVPARMYSSLSHVNNKGEARMVDISEKSETKRVAKASGKILFANSKPLSEIGANSNKKGDVISTARLAGIMAVKKTSDLIPLCHNINITKVKVDFAVDPTANGIEVICEVTCNGKTGVEMEALTGASVALLTLYDMCKAVDKNMVITGIRVLEKAGGKSGDYKFSN